MTNAVLCRSLVNTLNIQYFVTKGADGYTVYDSNQGTYNAPSSACEVCDVTGAGDTFIATLAFNLCRGANIVKASSNRK